MLKVDLNRYLVATGKTKLYISHHQLEEITEHYLTMTYRTKKDKINKINKLRKQVARIATKTKGSATEIAGKLPFHRKSVMVLEISLSSNDSRHNKSEKSSTSKTFPATTKR